MQNQHKFRGIFLYLVSALFLCIGCFSAHSGGSGTLIEFRESKYNNIYVYKRGSLVIMTFGHNRNFYTETIYDTRDEKSLPVPYTRYMTGGLAYLEQAQDILEIGFGGGRTTRYLYEHMPGTNITSIELDAEVLALAKKYFGVKASDKFVVKIGDGRRYLQKTKAEWDLILVDAYRGPFVPFHLLTREFFQKAKKRLKPGGVVVQNIEPTTMMFDSAIVTIKSVFKNVDLYNAGGNIVAVAYDGAPKSQEQLVGQARAWQKKHNFRYKLTDLISRRRIVTNNGEGKVLTDDFAPVEALLAIKRHNRKLDTISRKAVQ